VKKTAAGTASSPARLSGQRGSVLVQVAVALLALLALSAFVLDHGVMTSGRGAAQNAADAAALAGAVSLMNNQGGANAETAALLLARRHFVAGDPLTTNQIDFPLPTPHACRAPFTGQTACITVAINNQNVPTFFARLANVNSQGVRATATAIAGRGNSVSCIRPWTVADRWTDNSGTGLNPAGWDQMDEFNPGVDTYASPGFSADPTTTNDIGLQLVLKEGEQGTWSSGWTMQIDFGCPGANCYRDAISDCQPWIPVVGIYDGTVPCADRSDTPNPPRGCLDVRTGMTNGPTQQGVGNLIAQDTGASWNTGTNSVQGGCMASQTCQMSPRIVPIAIFNTAAYVAQTSCSGTGCRAQVSQIIGFFVEGMCDDVYPNQATRPPYCGTNAEARRMVVGRLMNYPGQWSAEAGNPGPTSFVRAISLVR
jgi:hypothetical protein